MVGFLRLLEFDILVLGTGGHRLLSDSARLQMSEKNSDRDGSWIHCRDGDHTADKDPSGHDRVNLGDGDAAATAGGCPEEQIFFLLIIKEMPQ